MNREQWLATRREALIDLAEIINDDYGEIWGGRELWVTNGHKVAAVVADTIYRIARDHAAFSPIEAPGRDDLE